MLHKSAAGYAMQIILSTRNHSISVIFKTSNGCLNIRHDVRVILAHGT